MNGRPFGATGGRAKGIGARSGEAPVWRCHNSDDWFSKDGCDGVSLNNSSFMPIWRTTKSMLFSILYNVRPNLWQRLFRMENLRFAYFFNSDSLNPCAAHKN
jgi:hypothetical protein